MRKTLCILLAVIAAFTAAAQNSIRVQAPSLVGVGEQFNVIVTVEGNDNPSDPEWSLGDEFQLVWGPQRIGTSSSINIVNGNRSKSVSYTFKYILLPKVKGTFTLPAATATVGGEKVTSNRVTVEVATDGASSGGQQISGGQTSPSQLPPEPAADLRNGGGDVFLRFSINKNKVIVGEPVTGTLKLFTRADVAGFEDARFPTFNGFWSQETYAPNSIQFRRENIGDKIYNTVVLREYTLIPQQTGDIVVLTLDAAPGAAAGSYRDIKATPGTISFAGWGNDMDPFAKPTKPTATVRFAVLRPTPGSSQSSSTVCGNTPSNFSFSTFGKAFRCLALSR